MCSCEHTINDSGVVRVVKDNRMNANTEYKYLITVNCGDRICSTIKIYTNSLYQVGDTIKFHKIKVK